MSFTIDCPHCSRALRVTEPAFGKTVPCPGCGQPIQIAAPPLETSRVAVPPSRLGIAQGADASTGSEMRLPPEMPPMPSSDRRCDLGRSAREPGVSGTLGQAVQRLNITDMFSGNDKEYVFRVIPDEERVAEITIHHQHFFVIKSGVTRVTLTTHRLLYTETRVFSPVYWLLLALFPPLIFYYVARLSRNRNVAMPLDSIDSVEKRYRPHRIWFLVAVVLGGIVAALVSSVMAIVFGSLILQFMVQWLILGLLAPAVLILLLATRIVGFDVRSRGNNIVPIRFGPGDSGVCEEEFDTFFQKVHIQMEGVRILHPQTEPATL